MEDNSFVKGKSTSQKDNGKKIHEFVISISRRVGARFHVPAHHRTPQASFFQTKQINPEEKM
jgi:hypothetical protein